MGTAPNTAGDAGPDPWRRLYAVSDPPADGARFPGLGRLLFLNENLGGHATMHLHIFRALAEHPEVDAVHLDVPAAGLARRIAGAQVPGLARLDLDLGALRSQLALSRVADRMLRRAMAEGPVGAIHAYSQHVALHSWKTLARYPSVVSTDGSAAQNAEQLPFRHPTRFTPRVTALAERYEARVFDAATIVVAQSEWAAGAIRDRYALGAERLRVIPFGIMPPVFIERKVREPFEITFTGNTMLRKGGTQLLRVFRERRWHERGVVLNLVTRDEVPDLPGVRAYPDLRPGDPRLVEMLARTAVFALPSEIDKSPYSVLEAMFAGVPVVSTWVGGVPEMVLDGETGLLVPIGDDHALAVAIERLLDDPAERERMGAAARALAMERFDARKTTVALLAVIAEAERAFAR